MTSSVIAHPELLSTSEDILRLAQSLQGATMVAFDTEFIRESTFYPIIEIIQVATDRESWLVDAQAFKKGHKPGPAGGHDAGIEPLLAVFRDPSVLKIVHAAQGDQECLYTSYGCLATPLFDTAVAASLCGYGEAIGLSKLLKILLDVDLKKGHARTNWSVRPLPTQLIEYAHADVEHLVAACLRLRTHLEKLGRWDWALEISSQWGDPALYEADLDVMARKLSRGGRLDPRGHAALRELIRWREDRVRQLNLPRRWVADDAVLIDLAHVRPKDVAHLSAFRGLNKGELKNSATQILEAIVRGADTQLSPLPKQPRVDAPTTEESQALDLLKCYIGMLADRHRIAAKHLMSSQQLLQVLRSRASAPDELVREGAISETAGRIIGEDLIAFLRGKKALSIEGTQVRIVTVA